MKPFDKSDAVGHWLHIYRAAGIAIDESGTKHGKCPLCGRDGAKGMRYTDTTGNGQCICTCKPDGIDGWGLLQEFKWGSQNPENFKKALDFVQEIIRVGGELKKVRPREEKLMSPIKLRKMVKDIVPYKTGDMIDSYLTSRGILARPSQRVGLHPGLMHQATKKSHPVMCGLWQMPDGRVPGFQRTFFDNHGGILTDVVKDQRKLMTRKTIASNTGGAIRMMDVGDSTVLGLSEGIESGLALADYMGWGQGLKTPVWACTTANLLERWVMPPEVEEQVDCFVIAVDADKSFTGQAASYILAKRLRLKGKIVNLVTPDKLGCDIVDIMNNKCGFTWV